VPSSSRLLRAQKHQRLVVRVLKLLDEHWEFEWGASLANEFKQPATQPMVLLLAELGNQLLCML
jgi:hypothetical protein